MSATVWHWLVSEGQLYHAVVGWLVGFLAGWLVSLRLGRKLRGLWHEHEQTQLVIADRLNPHTPGGIGDLRLPVKSEPLKEGK